MEGDTVSAPEVVSEALADAHAAGVATGVAIAESVAEQAQQEIDEAHEQAAAIARAAMETELGRQIAATNTRIDELWRDVQQSLQPLADLMPRLAEIEKVTTATAVLALSQSTPQVSTPPASETVTEAAAEVATAVLPEAVAAPVESTPAAPPVAAKRKHFL